MSPFGDRRCDLWGLKGKLKGDVSQGFHRLDPEAPSASPSQAVPEKFPALMGDYSKWSGGPCPPRRPAFTYRCEVGGRRQTVLTCGLTCGLTGSLGTAAQARGS